MFWLVREKGHRVFTSIDCKYLLVILSFYPTAYREGDRICSFVCFGLEHSLRFKVNVCWFVCRESKDFNRLTSRHRLWTSTRTTLLIGKRHSQVSSVSTLLPSLNFFLTLLLCLLIPSSFPWVLCCLLVCLPLFVFEGVVASGPWEEPWSFRFGRK